MAMIFSFARLCPLLHPKYWALDIIHILKFHLSFKFLNVFLVKIQNYPQDWIPPKKTNCQGKKKG
jgi:hypothetical protein